MTSLTFPFFVSLTFAPNGTPTTPSVSFLCFGFYFRCTWQHCNFYCISDISIYTAALFRFPLGHRHALFFVARPAKVPSTSPCVAFAFCHCHYNWWQYNFVSSLPTASVPSPQSQPALVSVSVYPFLSLYICLYLWYYYGTVLCKFFVQIAFNAFWMQFVFCMSELEWRTQKLVIETERF